MDTNFFLSSLRREWNKVRWLRNSNVRRNGTVTRVLMRLPKGCAEQCKLWTSRKHLCIWATLDLMIFCCFVHKRKLIWCFSIFSFPFFVGVQIRILYKPDAWISTVVEYEVQELDISCDRMDAQILLCTSSNDKLWSDVLLIFSSQD